MWPVPGIQRVGAGKRRECDHRPHARESPITAEAFKLLMGWGIGLDGILPGPPPAVPPWGGILGTLG